MRDVRNRQQWLLAATFFCAAATGFAEKKSAAQELVELKVREAASGSAEEWKAIGAEYAALVKKHPREATIRGARGEYFWRMNDRESAVREWLVGVKVEPKNAAILNHLGEAHLAMGEPRKSLAFFTRSSVVEPQNALTHFSIANIASVFRHGLGKTEQECFDLALRHFAEAHRLAPQNAEFARGYAETFYMVPKPDWPTALKVWQDCLNLMPEKDFVLLNLARVHMKLGDSASARACLAQVTGPEAGRQKNRLEARIEAELSPQKPPKSSGTENSPKPGIDEAPMPP